MTNNTSTERLLPCPFCAAQAKSWCAYPGDGDRAAFYIECDDCDARTCAWWTEAEAAAAWNRRAATPETERLRSVQDAVWNAAVRACAEAAQNADIACHRDYQRSDDGGGTLANARNDILKLLRPDSLLTPTRDPR